MIKLAVIGAGAAGMMAAIAAAEEGAEVTLYEKNDRVGKKILSTGNGKCNFSNRLIHKECYNGTGTMLVQRLFDEFSQHDTIAFFEKCGMLVKEKNGGFYPLSEQASTVLDLLRLQLDKKGVRQYLTTPVTELKRVEKSGRWVVITESGKETQLSYDCVLLACGGKAAPKTGSDGSGYRIAGKLGHRMIPAEPALVQLRCSNSYFKSVAGVRCEAELRLMSGKRLLQTEQGELQFTDYGISGIPVFQLSRNAAVSLRERPKEPVTVWIDLLPDLKEDYTEFWQRRLADRGADTWEEALLGLANKKLILMLIREAGLKPGDCVDGTGKNKREQLMTSFRRLCANVTGPNGFDQAQVCTGGIDAEELTEKLESKKQKGLFFAGELIDIDGRCGGYNLQWAWTSGYVAGKAAAGNQKIDK